MPSEDEPIAEGDAIAVAAALLNEHHVPAARSVRFFFGIFAIAAVVGLVMALLIVNNELGNVRADAKQSRVVTDCRAKIAAALRDADSEVVRQNAILKEHDSAITDAWSSIVEQLAKRETDFTANLAALHEARIAATTERITLDAAIDAQAVAREKNAHVVETCV